MFSREIYVARREALMSHFDGGLLLFLGHGESPMNYADNPYHFRQDSSFLYYFGLDQADLAGIIDVDAGSATIFGDELWFCTARTGVERSIDIYIAHRDGDDWLNWESAGTRLNIELEVGELHLADAGNSIYYHSERATGQGGIDIWVTHFQSGEWSEATNLAAVNTEYNDGWPWVSENGQELWLTHGPASPEIWRSLEVGEEWQVPEKVVGPFAGEATFDTAGNLYFTHHFWDDDTDSIIEADIYICQRK